MTGKDKVLKIAKRKKVFRANDVDVDSNLSRKYIARLVKEGSLVKVGYGLYSLAEHGFTESQDLIEVAVKVPKGIVCLLSALRFHDLTTQNPFEVWIAIERESRIPKVENVPVRFFRFAPKVYQAGIETYFIEGVEIKVYSAAKTIADCFKYQKTVGLDVALEAMRDAWRKRKVTMDELYHFAEIRQVKKIMLPYLNTLVM